MPTIATRTAIVVWSGALDGAGLLTTGTGALSSAPVSVPARVERPGADTSPEELLASAHATCFAMALVGTLSALGARPHQLTVQARCSLDRDGEEFRISTIALTVSGEIDGDPKLLLEAAQTAKATCPVSKAIAGNVDVSVDVERASVAGER